MSVNINKVVDIVKEREVYSNLLQKINKTQNDFELMFDERYLTEKTPLGMKKSIKEFAINYCNNIISELDKQLKITIES